MEKIVVSSKFDHADEVKNFTIHTDSMQPAIFMEKHMDVANATVMALMVIDSKVTGRNDVWDEEIYKSTPNGTITITFESGYSISVTRSSDKPVIINAKDPSGRFTDLFQSVTRDIIKFFKNLYFVDMFNRKTYSFYHNSIISENNWVGENLFWNKEEAEELFAKQDFKCQIVDNHHITTLYDEDVDMDDLHQDLLTYIAVLSAYDHEAHIVCYNADASDFELTDEVLESADIASALFILKE